jgi:hypothetical protein
MPTQPDAQMAGDPSRRTHSAQEFAAAGSRAGEFFAAPDQHGLFQLFCWILNARPAPWALRGGPLINGTEVSGLHAELQCWR